MIVGASKGVADAGRRIFSHAAAARRVIEIFPLRDSNDRTSVSVCQAREDISYMLLRLRQPPLGARVELVHDLRQRQGAQLCRS